MRENCFSADLRWSCDATHEPFWQEVYTKAFPQLRQSYIVDNRDLQRMGIDRILSLNDGRLLYIDEKLRRKAYGDIVLEYVADTVRNMPGWMEKDLQITHLAYAILPTRQCYLFPWRELKEAWRKFKPLFFQAYRPIEAINNGYSTLSIPIPTGILTNLVEGTVIIQL